MKYPKKTSIFKIETKKERKIYYLNNKWFAFSGRLKIKRTVVGSYFMWTEVW